MSQDELIKRALNSCEIKSQHELNTCNDGKRSSDVLLSTIEELERTKKQLDIAIECMREYLRGGCYPLMEKKLKEIEELNK